MAVERNDKRSADHSDFVANALQRALSAEGFTIIAAVFGVAVLVATVTQFGVSPLVLTLGVVLAILLAILYVCFSWVVQAENHHRSRLAGILAYTVVGLFSLSLVLVFVSAALDLPWPLRTVIVRFFGSPSDVAIASAKATKPTIAALGYSTVRPFVMVVPAKAEAMAELISKLQALGLRASGRVFSDPGIVAKLGQKASIRYFFDEDASKARLIEEALGWTKPEGSSAVVFVPGVTDRTLGYIEIWLGA